MTILLLVLVLLFAEVASNYVEVRALQGDTLEPLFSLPAEQAVLAWAAVAIDVERGPALATLQADHAPHDRTHERLNGFDMLIRHGLYGLRLSCRGSAGLQRFDTVQLVHESPGTELLHHCPTKHPFDSPDVLIGVIRSGSYDPFMRDICAVLGQITTGLTNWEFTEVLSGIREGEQVVTAVNREGIEAGVLVRAE